MTLHSGDYQSNNVDLDALRGDLAVGSLVGPVGFDQVEVTHFEPGAALGTEYVHRDDIGTPLSVALTGLTPGRILRVSWVASVLANLGGGGGNGEFGAFAVVSFDSPLQAYPTGWFRIVNAASGMFLDSGDPPATSPNTGYLGALAYFTIPAGKTRATVRLRYGSTSGPALETQLVGNADVVTPGQILPFTCSGPSLEVCQYSPSVVQQVGPGQLVAPPP